MKRNGIICIVAFAVFSSGCARNADSSGDMPAVEASASFAHASDVFVPEITDMATSSVETIPVANVSANLQPFRSELPLSLEETIQEYFNQQYLAYANLQYIDLDFFLDMDVESNKNLVAWTQTLIQRRRLLRENDLCYVDTSIRPFQIIFDSQPEDAFFSSMRGRGISSGGDTAVYFRITGDKGEAYPPFMAMNAQHIIILKQIDGQWKITMHYFPGAVRKFLFGAPEVPSEDAMLSALKEKFSVVETAAASQIPSSDTPSSNYS